MIASCLVWSLIPLALSNYHHIHTLDHMQARPESEIQEEQVQEDLVVHKHRVAWMLTMS
jgi:hypothetical protein